MLVHAYSSAGVHDSGNYLRDAEKTATKIARRPGGWARWRQAGGRVSIGHAPYGVLRGRLPDDTRYVTFLRDPVDRVLSHYHGHTYSADEAAKRAKKPPIVADSLEQALVEMRRPEFENLATRFLCGGSSRAELPASALDDAKANLREFAFVGLTERFDESMVLLQRALGLDLAPYYRQKINPDRPAAENVPAEQRALIAEHNQLDAELYEFGRQAFEETVAAAGAGLEDQVKALVATSELAEEEHAAAIEEVRVWLDRELPPGTSRSVHDVLTAAESAGISTQVLRRASKLIGVTTDRGDGSQRLWVRP